MADVRPNPIVEIARLQLRKQEVELNVSRGRLKLVEMEDERERIEENMKAAEKSIKEIEKQMESLKGTSDE